MRLCTQNALARYLMCNPGDVMINVADLDTLAVTLQADVVEFWQVHTADWQCRMADSVILPSSTQVLSQVPNVMQPPANFCTAPSQPTQLPVHEDRGKAVVQEAFHSKALHRAIELHAET